MNEEFSLVEAIITVMNRGSFSKKTLAILDQGIEDMRNAGLSRLLPMSRNSFVLPVKNRAVIDSSTAAGFIGIDKAHILPQLTENLVFAKAGATYLSGMTANTSIVANPAVTVTWETENADASSGVGTISEIPVVPKRLTAVCDVSRSSILSSGPAIETMLRNIIIEAIRAKLESTVLGVLAATATRPQGMGYKVTTGNITKAAAIVPTYANLNDLEALVEASCKRSSKLGYITSVKGRKILKNIARNAGGAEYLFQDDKINGYPAFISNSVSDVAGTDAIGSLLVFGNWADLIVAQYGGFDITVDPGSQALQGKVRLVVNSFFDIKGARGTAITNEINPIPPHEFLTDDDQYAYSFGSVAIK